MGNENSKANFRKSFVQLLQKTQPVDINDDNFWNQFWNEYDTDVQYVFSLIPSDELKILREESPNNMVTLCYKAVEKLSQLSESVKLSNAQKDTVLNCVRILTRLLPYLFEDSDWRSFFWSSVPSQPDPSGEQIENSPLAFTLISSLTDLLFFPDFTVSCPKKSQEQDHQDGPTGKVIDSCEYIWQSGVGFSAKPYHCPQFDKNRTEILKLLLTCFSETMYVESYDSNAFHENLWIKYFTGTENRHALPLFTSLLNTVFAYDPVGYGIPYNHIMFTDTQEHLMEIALQVLCVTLESFDLNKITKRKSEVYSPCTTPSYISNSISVENDLFKDNQTNSNLFIHYLSRIHRDEDFSFILRGFIRLLNNPLIQTYLPGSTKRIYCHQELLILLWRMCDINRRFLFYLLKSSHILDVLVPILYHLNDARNDQSRIGLVHIGVFILLMLSGERNFGVRLNKPYDNRVSMDIPVFTGTHADLLIIVFHKVITTGHQLLQPLFDCLLTVIVNISPYLKMLSMVTATKLLHLLEAFTAPWFLFSSQSNHHLVFFLLEVLNNIVQYQFDGNSNIVYCIIRKRNVFYNLVNLKTDHDSIREALVHRSKLGSAHSLRHSPKPHTSTETDNVDNFSDTLENNAVKAATLKDIPALSNMTSDYHRTVSNEISQEDNQSDSHKDNQKDEELPVPASTDEANNKDSSTPRCDSVSSEWVPTGKWINSWKQKLPLQTIMRLLQVLVPQVERLCIEKGLTDETEILKFLQRGTLVGLLPVPHPILIRKYQANVGTNMWFRTYMWGVIYLRNVDPPIWYDTNVRLFEIQKVYDK